MIPKYEIVCVQHDSMGFLQKHLNGGKIIGIGYNSPQGKIIIPLQKAIDMIKNDECTFYVKNGTREIPVFIVEKQVSFLSPSIEYLRTERDETKIDNLDNLPECT